MSKHPRTSEHPWDAPADGVDAGVAPAAPLAARLPRQPRTTRDAASGDATGRARPLEAHRAPQATTARQGEPATPAPSRNETAADTTPDSDEPRTGSFPAITTPTPLTTAGHLRGRVGVLDGVRAVAVLLVVAFHVGIPGVFAGFLGVDLFFVLSGFLISTLLLRQMHRRGRINLVQFWSRRVLRLLPAALLMLTVVALWTFTLAPPERREALTADLTWCLVYLGNWHFISESSYFVNDGTISPLQHVWSLAVEEQFYLVWPLAIVAVAWGLRRIKERTGFSALHRLWRRLVSWLMPVVAWQSELTGSPVPRVASPTPPGLEHVSAGTAHTPLRPRPTTDATSPSAPPPAAPTTSPTEPEPTFPAHFSAVRRARLLRARARVRISTRPSVPAASSEPTADARVSAAHAPRVTPAPQPAVPDAPPASATPAPEPAPEPSSLLSRLVPSGLSENRSASFAGPKPLRIPSLDELAQKSPAWMRALTSVARTVSDATRAPHMTPATIELLLLLGVFTVAMGTLSALVMAWQFNPMQPERAYMGTDTKLFEPLVGGMAAAAMIWPGVRSAVRRRSAWLLWPSIALMVVCLATLGAVDGATASYFTGGAFVFSVAAAAVIAVLVASEPTDVFDDQPQAADDTGPTPVVALGGRAGHTLTAPALMVGRIERVLRRALLAVLASPPLTYLGRISYSIYLWHWPFTVWIIGDTTGAFDPGRVVTVLTCTLLAAAASYHLVEKPILTGKFASLRPRLVLMLGLGAACIAAGGIILASALQGPHDDVVADGSDASPTAPATPRWLIIGDSVPSRLGRELKAAGEAQGIEVDVAAMGGCGGMPANTSVFTEVDCTERVPATQNKYLNAKKYTAVVWWSRWELAPRRDADVGVIRQDTDKFWHRHSTQMRRTVEGFIDRGAKVVVIEPERPGVDISRVMGNNPTSMPRILRDNPYQVRQRWITTLRDTAAQLPNMEVVSLDQFVCRNDASPCDDRLPLREDAALPFDPPTGPEVRTDGTHYTMAEGRPVIARIVINQVRQALGLPAPSPTTSPSDASTADGVAPDGATPTTSTPSSQRGAPDGIAPAPPPGRQPAGLQ